MIYGISGAPIPAGLRYANPVEAACAVQDVPPCLAYAIAWRETIVLEASGQIPDAATVISGDGGRGLMQLTASYPDDWANPIENVAYAIAEFILPAIHYWHGLQGFSGDTLVLLVAATYNEGLGSAEEYHARGDVDAGTTDHYGHGVLGIYKTLAAGNHP